MPGGDGRGPLGLGPMTGRGGGYCMAYNYRHGQGPGYCRGYFLPGRMGRRGFYGVASEEMAEFKLRALKEEQRFLEDHLKTVKEEVQQMEKEEVNG